MLKNFDYGILGEEKYGTDFWCVIKEVFHDGSILVVDENGEEVGVDFPRFKKIGNLLDEAISERKTASVPNCLVCHHNKDEYLDNVFAEVVEEQEPGDGYVFHKGVLYPVFYGCLLDENDSCAFDKIETIDDLNLWDQGSRIWKINTSMKVSDFDKMILKDKA